MLEALAIAAALNTTPSETDDLKLCHVANAGFLVETNNVIVLLDALRVNDERSGMYKMPSKDTINTILRTYKPIISLATHLHNDHFDPRATEDLLLRKGNVHLFMTDDAYEVYKSKQTVKHNSSDFTVLTGDPNGVTTFNKFGVTVDIYKISHGVGRVDNNGYRVTVDSVSFFHPGDINTDIKSLQQAGLDKLPVDYLLMPYWMGLTPYSKSLVDAGWNFKHIIPMHIDPVENPGMRRFGGFKGLMEKAHSAWPNTIELREELACITIEN